MLLLDAKTISLCLLIPIYRAFKLAKFMILCSYELTTILAILIISDLEALFVLNGAFLFRILIYF